MPVLNSTNKSPPTEPKTQLKLPLCSTTNLDTYLKLTCMNVQLLSLSSCTFEVLHCLTAVLSRDLDFKILESGVLFTNVEGGFGH